MTPSVLHVMPALGRGGPGRALLTLAAAVGGVRHRVAVLRPVESTMRDRLAAAGLELLDAPGPQALAAAMGAADVVHLHFWNSPELHELLHRPWPETRLLTWCHVHGGTVPQVLPRRVCDVSDLVVAATELTWALPHLTGVDGGTTIPQIADATRVVARPAGHRAGFTVGYVGMVDPAKMHPRFAAMAARVQVQGVRFVVCGTGGGFASLAREAAALGMTDRMDLGGYVEDVGVVLAGFDAFGYPLAPGNYSSGELALQEAMHAGVPPVVLPHGGAATLVVDGESGVVAADEDAYVAALERLAADPGLRARLGAGARERAQRLWTPERVGPEWQTAYDGLLERPKRERRLATAQPMTGAERFLAGLDGQDGAFRASLGALGTDASADADAQVAGVPDTVLNADGGILDYRRRYPSDPHLRLWSGLALAARGRRVFAAGELSSAVRLGLDPRRVAAPLAALELEGVGT